MYCLLHFVDSRKHIEALCSSMELVLKVYELDKQCTVL